MEAVNVAVELDRLTEHWSPRVFARANDQYVEVGIVLIETVTTAHTGDVVTECSVPVERQLRGDSPGTAA